MEPTITIAGIKALLEGAGALARQAKNNPLNKEISELYDKLRECYDLYLNERDHRERLERRIRELETAATTKAEVVKGIDSYWKMTPSGVLEGPFCQTCFDSNGKLINVTLLPRRMSLGTHFCGVCKNPCAPQQPPR